MVQPGIYYYVGLPVAHWIGSLVETEAPELEPFMIHLDDDQFSKL